MFFHVLRHKREEVEFLLFLRSPLILTASTPFLRGADSFPLDLSVVVVFPVTSVSLSMSILHVGLVLGIELQLHRDVHGRR